MPVRSLFGALALLAVSVVLAQVKDDGAAGPGSSPDPNGPNDNAGLAKEAPELVPARVDPRLPKESDGAAGPASVKCAADLRVIPSARLRVDLAAVPETRLDPLDTRGLLDEDARSPKGGRFRVSVGRGLSLEAGVGPWLETGGGRVWAADVVSPGAVALRLHFDRFDLPPGAELWIYAPAHPESPDGPHQGKGPIENGSFWSGTIEGDRARIEIYTPNDPAAQAFSPPAIDAIQHGYRDPLADAFAPEGTCDNDVTCSSAFTNVSHGTTRLTFVENGNGFLCTGQLINPQNGDLTPYVLTANRCIDTNTVAQTTQFFWLYQTAACNGTPPTLSSVPKSSVGTLAATGTSSDFTILMEEGALPCGLFWPGFDTTAIATGQASASIHHTGGTAKRISFGTKATADASSCTTGSPNFVRVNWTDGMVGSGGEGAPIFRTDTQRVYGQFSCGPATCASPTFDNFGAMAATFSGSTTVQSLLAGGSDDALEPNDTCATAITVAEGTFTNRVVKYNHDDWFKISVPAGGQLSATATFTNANGDIDMELFSTCGGTAVASSAGTTNVESFVFTNTGATATFLLHVFLSDCDTRNSYTLALQASLPNDTCAAPTVIPGTATTFTPAPFSTTQADASGTEPQENCEVGAAGVSNTVWYSFTPCGTGEVTIDTFGTNYDTVLSMFTGTCAAATQVACSDNAIGTQARILNMPVTAGTTYLIKVADYNTTAGGGTLDFNFNYAPAEPANDACGSAIVIPGNATAFNPAPFCTVGAAVTAGDPAESCGFTTNSNPVYYSFTPCDNGHITVDTNGSGYDTVLSIFSGTCGSPDELACDDDSGTGLNSQLINVPVTGGTTYLIKVADFGNPDGGTLDFNFSYTPTTVPVNDACGSPTIIPANSTTFAPPVFCTMAAGASISEPQEGCEVGGVGVSNTVWYSFVACGNGTVSLDTNGSNYDTVLSMFTGTCGAATQVACDDDSGAGANSQLNNVPVTAGTSYLIKVADYGGPNGGSLVFHFSYAPTAPPNDLCSAATAIPSLIYNPPPECTMGASLTVNEPAESCGLPPNAKTVWYRYVPAATGLATFNTYGSDYATVLGLFTGSCASSTPVACTASAGPQSEITTVLNGGVTYLIKVAALGNGTGGSLGFNFAFQGSAAGEVPDAAPAQPLLVSRSGSNLLLDWDPSCNPNDTEFDVYEGTIGFYYSHSSRACAVTGSSLLLTPQAADSYYLVVPANGPREGSYGRRGNGSERPPGSNECLPQNASTCP